MADHVIPIVACQWWDDQFDPTTACRNVAEPGRAYCHEHLDGYIPPMDDDEPGELGDELRSMLIDWEEFWRHDFDDADWLAEPIIPKGRSVALFAPGGTGKSLLALWMAAKLATGHHPFDPAPLDPLNVLYLDYEMTLNDLAERLEGMGFDRSTNLEHLHYALLPSLPPLDSPEGGTAVLELAEHVDADLVIVDTFGRAIHGDENDADTIRSWYRWTGIHLKHAGRAFVRVDHAGKDLAKGQRGSSAKNDDVDVVWKMTPKEGGAFQLRAVKRRMGWVPLTVDLDFEGDDGISFALLGGDTWEPGTVEVAQLLDELGVDVETSARAASRALNDAKKGKRSSVVRDAVKYRKRRSLSFHFDGDRPVDNP